MKIKEKLMHKYALSPQGASDMLKAFVSVTVSDLVLMIPVSLLYFIVKDYMEGTLQGKGGFYIAGIIVTLALIAITTYIQYNATFLSTYVESEDTKEVIDIAVLNQQISEIVQRENTLRAEIDAIIAEIEEA